MITMYLKPLMISFSSECIRSIKMAKVLIKRANGCGWLLLIHLNLHICWQVYMSNANNLYLRVFFNTRTDFLLNPHGYRFPHACGERNGYAANLFLVSNSLNLPLNLPRVLVCPRKNETVS